MNQNTEKLKRMIVEGALSDAIVRMRSLITAEHSDAKRQLDEVDSVYQNLLHYFAQGIKDEKTPDLLQYIRRNLMKILNRWDLDQAIPLGTGVFYDRMRYRRSIGYDSIASLCKHIAESEQRKSYDELVKNLFDALWTIEKLSEEDRTALRGASEYVRLNAISAIGMSLLEFWDESKFHFLLDELSLPDSSAAYTARILLSLTLALRKHRFEARLHEKDFRNRLDSKYADTTLGEYLEELYIRFFYACQTEQISKKLKEEVLDNMQEILPKMQKFGMKDLDQQQELDPEWIEELERSGLNEKIQEINELQQDGADVMHSTFMNLKDHAFFREMQNWFLPFDAEHHSLAPVLQGNEAFRKLAEGLSTQLCDSDRYSLLLSLERMPAEMRSQAIRSMGADLEQMQEQLQGENPVLGESQSVAQAIKMYIQNLYRFYKIYERKGEFEDIFAQEMPIDLPLWGDFLQPFESRKRFAEFFFRHKLYAQALGLFETLALEAKTDAQLYKKLGYCHQQRASYHLALGAYCKADLIEPDNDWLQKRLAYCHRKLGNRDQAIELTKTLFERKPEETQLLMQLGNLYLEAERYQDALNCLHRYEYEGQYPQRAQRAIAWASFLMGNYQKAADYYKQILERQEQYNDHLNAGHTALAMGQIDEAIRHYRRSVALNLDGISAFRRSFEEDTAVLLSIGLSLVSLQLIPDAVALV